MEGVTLVFLALLAGVVLYLVLNQRNFQRVDYSHLIMQEERERQLVARLEQAERLLADLRAYDRERRRELDELTARTRTEVAHQLAQAKEELTRDVLGQPEAYDHMLAQRAGVSLAQQPERLPRVHSNTPATALPAPAPPQSMVRFLRGPRQRQIAEMLELGFTHQEVTRELGVSGTEVGLVAAIIFGEKTA